MCQILKEKTEADPIAVISNFLAQYKEELNQQYAKDVLQNKDYSEEISQLREAKKDTLQCMRETFDELKMNRSLSIPTQVSNSTTERHQENDKEKICLRNDSIDTIQREIDAIVFMKRTQ